MQEKDRDAPKIGIIGGTGVYDSGLLSDHQEVKVHTPFGESSDIPVIGRYSGRDIAFIARHGRGHRIPPHLINYQANIWALKELSVDRILAPAAVGSLREGMAPGDIVIPDQFIDNTRSRTTTFYSGGTVCHISMADPFCPQLRAIIIEEAKNMHVKVHENATYVCVEGPRFSTRAESKMFREWGADIIGMTLVPECVLAREAEICYATIATVTDYDVWADKPVSAQEVVKTSAANVKKTKRLLEAVVARIPRDRNCNCGTALKDATQ